MVSLGWKELTSQINTQGTPSAFHNTPISFTQQHSTTCNQDLVMGYVATFNFAFMPDVGMGYVSWIPIHFV